MTESEAIQELKNMRLFMQIEDEKNECKFAEDDYKANEMAIKALEEVQQYWEIGTIEEFRKLVQKQKDVKGEIRFGIYEILMNQMPHCFFSTPKANKMWIIKYLEEHETDPEFIDKYVDESFCWGFHACKVYACEDLKKYFKLT